MKQRIPAVMYHSIGVVSKKWHWNHLTCPYEVFEDQLKWLKKTKHNTLNFQEVYDYIIHDKPVPKKSIFLTFDDGYLDNYVYAYPLLKKYGMKGTIFVNPDFVDKSRNIRKTLEDLKEPREDLILENGGFCNWEELKKMDSEGVLDVQSHAKTHTWYPISDKIIDFRHPGDDYIWMDWNENPDKKPYLQFIDRDNVRLGTAIFEHEKALSSKRVHINDEFQNRLNKFVKNNGGILFFNQENWKEILITYSDVLKKELILVTKTESHDEYLERLKYELDFTKKIIEEKLIKTINFICWPGGSATKEGLKIADELGYLMSCAAGNLTDSGKKIMNCPDDKINRIARFTPLQINNWSYKSKSFIVEYSYGWFFILQSMQFRNKYFARYWVKMIHYVIIKIKLYVTKK